MSERLLKEILAQINCVWALILFYIFMNSKLAHAYFYGFSCG